MSEVLTEILVNGRKIESGGIGCRISFEDLAKELKRVGVMNEKEEVSQINVHQDSIVFYFQRKEA